MFFSKAFRKKLHLFLFCCFSYALGLAIFMNGLVSSSTLKLKPIPPQDLFDACSERVTEDVCLFQKNMLKTVYSNHYQKVILMVIDALRADFIPSIKYNPKFNLSMPFTEILLKNGSALSLLMQGFAPTVTLPRIKTLVTGSISSFLDVLLNFNAAELSDDNILKQASSNGFKSVFYGDNTWLKLFPNLFHRSEGTHSFFVSDFQEVDYNVSKHIKYEITQEDWNILILHFLGVDHIGHAYGPFSEHLAPKLIEMDKIIKYMYENLKSNYGFSTLIIVCGDHGMTNSGSHGGITEEELLTPLIFIDTTDHQINLNNKATIDQVDFAPTLSVLMGIPIPVNSFGKIISIVLQFAGFSPQKILDAQYYNFLQISNIYKHFFPSFSKHSHFAGKTIESHYKWIQKKINNTPNSSDYITLLKSYETLLTDMKKDLLSISTGYNEILILFGLTIMWLSLLFSIQVLIPLQFSERKIFKILVTKRFFIIFCIMTVCAYFMSSYIIVICLLSSLLIFICQVSFLFINIVCKDSVQLIGKICSISLLIHALSLFSSSFIEEEHQTWYYFTSTLAVLLCYQRLSFFLNMYLKDHSTHALSIYWQGCRSTVCNTFALLLIHRIFCKWNQVGNKWQHLPDISDWLNQQENVIFLGMLVLLSQFIFILYFKKKLSNICFVLFSSGIVCITLHKMNNLCFFLNLGDYTIKMLIPWTVYIFSVLIIILSFFQLNTSSVSSCENVKSFILHFLAAWILLVEIIGRVHNIPLITVTFIQEYFLKNILWTQDYNITNNTVCYFIIGMASFYIYGNSNSFSTIDVVTGYTGMQSYRPVIVTLLLFCNTYSTMVMWLAMIPYRIMQLNHSMYDFKYLVKRIKFIFLILLNYKLSILSFYCIIVYLMRHHLFIYSVFFPKLFYEISHVIVIIITSFLVSLILDKAQ